MVAVAKIRLIIAMVARVYLLICLRVMLLMVEAVLIRL